MIVKEALKDILMPKTEDEVLNSVKKLITILVDPEEDHQDLVNQIIDEAGPDFEEQVDEFIFWASNSELSSAIEIWMMERNREKLWTMFQNGYNIASFSGDTNDYDDISEIIEHIKKLGWEEFASTYNYNSFEYIFIKPPQKIPHL